jgi:basic membrane protein A and related proteins
MIARFSLHKKSIWLASVLAATLLGAFALLPGVIPVRADGEKIGLITDSPILADGGFNEMANDGLLRAKTDLVIVETVYLSIDQQSIEDNLAQCVSDGNALCITVGYLAEEATRNAALANPETKFAILDMSYDDYPQNLQGAVFASEQAAYLAGTLAGKMTESDVLGMIGGMDIPPVNVFLCGFEQGVIDINPEATILLTYTDGFTNPALGAAVAQDMLDEGADVIFPAAGPTGHGALLTATQTGAWAVGVDSDQYLTVFAGGTVTGADHLLTSAMKRLDNAVFQIISETVSGNFVSGTVVYDLAVEGVDLAPYHEADAAIPPDAKAAVEAARDGLLDGSIDPLRSCRSFNIYLPQLNKDSQSQPLD